VKSLYDGCDYSSASIFTIKDKSDILGAVVFATRPRINLQGSQICPLNADTATQSIIVIARLLLCSVIILATSTPSVRLDGMLYKVSYFILFFGGGGI
jgi:hypothetical protein